MFFASYCTFHEQWREAISLSISDVSEQTLGRQALVLSCHLHARHHVPATANFSAGGRSLPDGNTIRYAAGTRILDLESKRNRHHSLTTGSGVQVTTKLSFATKSEHIRAPLLTPGCQPGYRKPPVVITPESRTTERDSKSAPTLSEDIDNDSGASW